MEGNRPPDGPKQRDKWVVRVDGIDTTAGKHRPRQLGTYRSQRSASAAARSMRADDLMTERGTVSWLVRRYVAGRTDITHMVQAANDLGELRAIADLLGHSPEMLMNTYAHALPDSQSAVVARIGKHK